MHTTNDEDRGLYGKFNVSRVDGSSDPGGKHDGCDYFVLDLTHDPFAVPALRAYIAACEGRYPLLAADLKAKLPPVAPPDIVEALAQADRAKHFGVCEHGILKKDCGICDPYLHTIDPEFYM